MSLDVCDHGSLRRKCELCERDERIAALEAENARLKKDADSLYERMRLEHGETYEEMRRRRDEALARVRELEEYIQQLETDKEPRR